MREVNRDPETLNRPEGNDLQSNYEYHDVGERCFHLSMLAAGYELEDWGMDMREHTDSLLFEDDRMDFKVLVDGELRGIVDVKTKTSRSWFGKYNERHYEKYARIAEEHDVPTYVAMFLLDDAGEEVIDEAFIPILGDREALTGHTFQAPDGNQIIVSDEDYYCDWDEMIEDFGGYCPKIQEEA